MKNKYMIGIWGQFGDGGKISDGQAVRTTVITEELKKRYGRENICIVNTNNWKKHPFSFLFNSVSLLKNCRRIVVFPADNGFKIIVPLYDFFNRVLKRELYDVVIGGYLPELLDKERKYIKMLKKYKALFVQTVNIKKAIEKNGLDNVQILSNLKRLNTRKASDIDINTCPDVTVCTFSRINESKGISDALEAVRLTNNKLGQNRVKLHIYGAVPDDYTEKFERLLEEYKDIAEYKGIADYDKTVETMTPYFALLFPTHYYGEGFPGCVVDAYNTGLPIIATDWNYNGDVIKNDVNGILVPIKSPEALSRALMRLYNDREYHRTMALNNLREAEKYSPDVVLADFYSYMDKQGR